MTSNYYVDKKEFLEQIIAYKQEKRKNPDCPIPECLGEKIFNICNGVMLRYNFSNYSYRDEMVSDAIFSCIRYFDNFDETKYSNPYGYFWLVAYRAGQRRLMIEKRQQAIKARHIQEVIMVDDIFDDGELQEYQNYIGSFFNFDLDAYDESIKQKKGKKK